MHRLGQRHHYGSGLGYTTHHNTALGPGHQNGYHRRHKNECFCSIF